MSLCLQIRKVKLTHSRELDHKEGWVLKNWCFQTVVLEKTLESPLDCKEIQPVHPKGDQSWIFIGRIDAEAEAPILGPCDAKNWLIGKDPDVEKNWRQEKKGMTEDEMTGWHHRLNGHEFEQSLGDSEVQGGLASYSAWESTKSWTWLNDWTTATTWCWQKKEIHRSIEQSWEPRNKRIHVGMATLWVRKLQWRKDSLFNKYCWENSTTRCKKNEARQLLYTIYKNQFKIH